MSHLHHTAGVLAALTDLGLVKLAKEFAPGIKASKPTSPLPTLTRAQPNLDWTFAVQDHKAKRARRHFDLRLVDADAGRAHSWAIPKARMPEPGERLLAVQTYTHTPHYALNFGAKKTQTIGKGYGAGTVRMALKKPTQILEANNTKVRFSVGDTEYLLKRTHKDKWLLMNTTKNATD